MADDKHTPEERESRISGYLKKLKALKERSSLREVTERELLLEFIRINHSNINEFPMLKTQQNGIINLVCHRASGHPGAEYIKKIIAGFVSTLTRYEKATGAGDKEQAKQLLVDLGNTETLVIKCIQGVVYASSLTADNFEEVFIRHFGAESIDRYNKLLENNEMDEGFWRALIDTFVATPMKEAFQEMVANEKYTISKEKSLLIIRFNFDDVLERLKQTSQEIQKTRVQSYFERNFKEPEYRQTHKLVKQYLEEHKDIVAKGGSEEDVSYISRLVCIDTVGLDYKDEALRRNEGEGQEEAQWTFLKEQVLASAAGAAISVDTVRDDFVRALRIFRPNEIEIIKTMVRYFDIGSLQRLLLYLLEAYFLQILTERAEGEGSKVRVRSVRQRRVSERLVNSLAESGLNKIRKNKLFGADRSKPGVLLFKPRTVRELRSIIQVLQIEPQLAARIGRVWEAASFKVDILIVLNLGLISRTTTNIKARLAEILGKFDIGLSKPKPQEEEPAEGS